MNAIFHSIFFTGHGADVKCVHWHPQKSLVISGSKDNQQPVKLWDPKTGQSLATLHAHKSTVMDVKWNENGNWLVTASRDHLLKLFDLRNLSQEVQTFRGHKKEASSVAWHPSHEGLFCSGGSDGAILFWHVGYISRLSTSISIYMIAIIFFFFLLLQLYNFYLELQSG